MNINPNLNKWSSILNSVGLSGNTWLEQYTENQFIQNKLGNIPISSVTSATNYDPFPFSSFAFPLVKRVMTTTLAGGWVKSKKQQLKENRINKLRKIKGLKPNIILPDDEYIDGLVAVQPLSAPVGQLFYMDFVYKSPSVQVRKNRKEKLIKIERISKIKYIEKLLKK